MQDYDEVDNGGLRKVRCLLIAPRFDKDEIHQLIAYLRIKDIVYRYSNKPEPVLALCILLRRLCYPSRWTDLSSVFGRSPTFLSAIFTDVVNHLIAIFEGLIAWHPRLRSYRQLTLFARAIYNAGSPREVWGFINGHFQGIARPGED